MSRENYAESGRVSSEKRQKNAAGTEWVKNSFVRKILRLYDPPPRAVSLDTLQVNLGYKCNMSCKHCHVGGGPRRREMMTLDNIEKVVAILDENPINTIDLTGGAPELHPRFRYLVNMAVGCRKKVLVRCNLTIIFEKGMEYLPSFYHDHGVELIASLPSFEKNGTERVRGKKVFDKSLKALRILNEQGFGMPGSGLRLHLVHNPSGAFLPPKQKDLENRYREKLSSRYGLSFNNLYTFTNMPIGRFKEFLHRTSNYEAYMDKLRATFNPAAFDGIMCRHMLNVGWNGTLYDCDFNQVSGCKVAPGYPDSLQGFDYERLSTRPIAYKEYCFGCTAGQGSS